MSHLPAVARLNRRLLRNCLDGTEAVLWTRPLDGVNALGFLALHLVDCRHFALGLLGAPRTNPFAAAVEGVTSMADLRERPGLEALVAAWEEVSPALEAALEGVGAERLAAPVAQRFPLGEPTLGGALEFLLHHESYHVGQMAFVRRCFELPAMRYD